MSDDTISRAAAINELESGKDKTAKGDIGGFYNAIIQNDIDKLRNLPSAQPDYQEVLGWLLAYHTKSFDLRGRYMANEVIGWLVHDFASAYMAERQEKE